MVAESKQKWIKKNRAPRVQIQYETEINGAQRKVDLAHVVGVMSDLSGNSEKEKPAIRDREFLEVDVDNFDERLRAIEPRVTLQVDNVLTEEGGKIPVDLKFQSMNDFSPGEIAKNVDGIKELLEARNQLKNLLSYMDGKANAEEWVTDVLKDKALLKSLMEAAKPAEEEITNKAED